jgi:hypothetical protein
MKKAYLKPKAKKVSFQYNKVVANSGYCDQGWTKETTLDPSGGACPTCYKELIWLGSTKP